MRDIIFPRVRIDPAAKREDDFNVGCAELTLPLRTRDKPLGEYMLPVVRIGKDGVDGGTEVVPVMNIIFTLVVFETGLRCTRKVDHIR